MRRLSIRTALTAALLGVVLVSTLLFSALGIWTIARQVREDAQRQVNNDLETIRAQFDRRIEELAVEMAEETSDLVISAPRMPERLARMRERLRFQVLNVCDAQGGPMAGAYPSDDVRVPVERDPVLRRALQGQPAGGVVLLERARLLQEGGPALASALAVASDASDAPGTDSALFRWFARPLTDNSGRVVGLVYGGRALNRNYDLVDRLRDLVLGSARYDGKPLGTVTIFLEGTRVATNVRHRGGRRAVGTVVSDEVRRRVLVEGERWQARAWVVDAWYISAYEPLRNPDDEAVGMLYVGLLEAPYRDFSRRLILKVLGIMLAVALIALAAVSAIFNRLTAPLRRLEEAVGMVARGEREARLEVPPSYVEVERLAEDFRKMQEAIAERDRSLEARNLELAESNTQLEQANRNYMETLGFVTHELKSPLAAMQSTIDLLARGYMGEVPEKIAQPLTRIQRNCEELQDMVKNYLDLSRAERGELTPEIAGVEVRQAVIDPCIANTASLFESRRIELEVDAPESLDVHADEELLRIALTNYLSNAAKYGREGGKARLVVKVDGDRVEFAVWNEGEGFSPEEGEKLFGKFARLQNRNTRGKRGSGLGLFLCRRIAEGHGGQARAESVPGEWARFILRIPARRPT